MDSLIEFLIGVAALFIFLFLVLLFTPPGWLILVWLLFFRGAH